MDSLAGGVDDAVRSLGGLDVVITVAGRGMVGTIASDTPHAWRDPLDLNLIGPLATVRHAVGRFAFAHTPCRVAGPPGGNAAVDLRAGSWR